MISIKKHSGIYTLESTLLIPVSINQAWEFFSSPLNLARITPPEMGFKVTSANLSKIYAGQIITYKVGVLPLIKTNWVTEITQVREPFYFIDEQRSGPYSLWHHEHFFEETSNGVLMTDRVSYKIPLGWLGDFLTEAFIKRQLLKIFSYRAEILSSYDFEKQKSILLI